MAGKTTQRNLLQYFINKQK